jgi:hypothetical protein
MRVCSLVVLTLLFTYATASGEGSPTAAIEEDHQRLQPAARPLQLGEDLVTLPILTPLPDTVPGIAKPLLNLCGKWRFACHPPADFPSLRLDDRKWPLAEVPGEWAMQGFTVPPGTAAAYRQSFPVPGDWAGFRIKLRCDAVYSQATVWVNGSLAGSHMGGFTPFELNVTDLIHPGKSNLIVLAVKKESLTDEKFTTFGSKYAAHPLGGITRKMMLLAVPSVHLRDLHAATRFDKKYRDATLQLSLEVANEGTQTLSDAQVRFELIDPSGHAVAIKPYTVSLGKTPAGEVVVKEVQLPVTCPAPWDVEHPRLYTLLCHLEAGGKRLETVRRRFGFRQVEVRENQLLVNGRPVKLRGVCRHEAQAIRGRSLAPGMWRSSAELFRSANINLIRTSHYPPAEEFLDACDELGIFVEEEAPFHHAEYITTPEYRRATLQHTAEMVQRDRSHPSVIIWSVGNEASWSPNFEASAELIRRLDPIRPRLFSHGDNKRYSGMRYGPLELDSWHYPGPAGPARTDSSPRPVLFDEYCHLNTYNREEIVTDPGLRDAWGQGFAQMWEKMYAAKGCLGGALWAGIDEVYFLPSREVGWGAWGLIDSWYRPKPEYWHVKKVYSPVRVPEEPLPVPRMGEPVRVPIANRNDFSNLKELTIRWSVGDESGTTSADVPPRSTGTLAIRPRSAELAGRKLRLEFHSPRGFLIDAYELDIGQRASPRIVAREGPPVGKIRILETGDTITLKGNQAEWRVDRHTGMIRGVRIDGRTALVGGPVLMILSLKGGECAQTHRANIPAHNNTCTEWQADTVAVRPTEQGAEIQVKGSYREARGSYTLLIDAADRLTIRYRFQSTREVNPRQAGIVFDLPRDCDLLSWNRKALWSVYPPDHIGRPVGQAQSLRRSDWPSIAPREQPLWPWALDCNALGSNDFRATRHNIWWASLQDAKGTGIRIDSDGRQHARAFVDGTKIRMLVAGFSTAGGDLFFSRHLAGERRPLRPGSLVEDQVSLTLLRADQRPQNRTQP